MDFKESLEDIEEKTTMLNKLDYEVSVIKDDLECYILDTFAGINVETSNEELSLDKLVEKITIIEGIGIIINLNPEYFFSIPKELYGLFDGKIRIQSNSRDGISLILDYDTL